VKVRRGGPFRLVCVADMRQEPRMSDLSHRLSIAPMMEWTDGAEKQSVIST
jgi:hypothetical protein